MKAKPPRLDGLAYDEERLDSKRSVQPMKRSVQAMMRSGYIRSVQAMMRIPSRPSSFTYTWVKATVLGREDLCNCYIKAHQGCLVIRVVQKAYLCEHSRKTMEGVSIKTRHTPPHVLICAPMCHVHPCASHLHFIWLALGLHYGPPQPIKGGAYTLYFQV